MNEQDVIRTIFSMEKKFLKTIPKPAINVSFHLTDACNLNCAGCYHFAPLVKEINFANLEEFENDIKRLQHLLWQDITVFTLFGGEPLLHAEVHRFPYIIKKYLPGTQIDIITNGLLIPNQSDLFWKSCLDNDVVIQWTKYPIKEEINTRIEKTLSTRGVNYRVFSGDSEKELGHFVIDVNGVGQNGQKQRNDARWQWLNCDKATNCIQLKNQKLYPCSIAANAHLFIDYFELNMRLSEWDGINIYNAVDRREILDFLARPIPFCRYCKVEKQTFGHKFSVSNKQIGEWT